MDWGATYNSWTDKRGRKLVELLGESWFKGKRVLTGYEYGHRRYWIIRK